MTPLNPSFHGPVSVRMADALDSAVEDMLKVLVKWGGGDRGPNSSWARGIAETARVLVDARVALGGREETP